MTRPSLGKRQPRSPAGRRAIHAGAPVLLSLAALSPACDGDEGKARLVEPIYEDPCRFFPEDACSEHGECHPDARDRPVCLCSPGYQGDRCASCEEGFHFDARGLCVGDRGCEEQPSDPCGDDGTCAEQAGVLTCACADGYGGPRCTLCARGYARGANGRCTPDTRGPHAGDADSGSRSDGGRAALDAGAGEGGAPPRADCPASSKKRVTTVLGFDGLEGWPALDNQCDARAELALPQANLKSRVGSSSAYVWMCAPANTYAQGMSTPHVQLEAAPLQVAQITFPSPISSLRFDYSAPANALALDVLVDNDTTQAIELTQFGRDMFSLQLSAPASVIGLRSRSAYRQTIAIDNLEYQSDQCP